MMSKSVGITWPLIAAVLAVLVVFCSEKHATVVNGQVQDDDSGKTFLDTKERDVMTIAANATMNNNGCQGLNGCGGSACSRAVCQVPVGSAKSLQQCYTVDNNENFNICSRPACPNMLKLDYNQSFVTLPAPGSLTLRPEVAKEICLQKPLDEGCFQYISVPNDYILVYFGSVSGAFRAWPGREGNSSYCAFFDTRRRPWYLNGISVKKDVKILIDVSLSMGKTVSAQYRPEDSLTTYLDLTQNITHALLRTFSPDDFVEVFMFDSSRAKSLTGGPVLIKGSFGYTISEGPDREELKPLINEVNSLVASDDVGASNLTNALNNATSSFKEDESYSRVIIVLTDGQFAPVDASFPTVALASRQTKVMIYKLNTGVDDTSVDDVYLLTTSLETAVCSVNGSFEVLDANVIHNPLYAMRSYFTFLARTQLVAAANKSSWSKIYPSADQELNAITVTYPAFGSDGQLIGVAGVDVIVDGLDNTTLQGLVWSGFANRRQGTLPAPSNIPLTCSYQKEAASVQCQNKTQANDSAICQPNLDKTTPLQDLTCCGTCNATKEGLSTEAKVGIRIGVPIGGILLFAVIAGTILCICRRRVDPDEDEIPRPVNDVPGPPIPGPILGPSPGPILGPSPGPIPVPVPDAHSNGNGNIELPGGMQMGTETK